VGTSKTLVIPAVPVIWVGVAAKGNGEFPEGWYHEQTVEYKAEYVTPKFAPPLPVPVGVIVHILLLLDVCIIVDTQNHRAEKNGEADAYEDTGPPPGERRLWNLAQKVKDNRSALTRVEKVMEGLKEEARKKSRAVSNIKAAKRKKILEAKAERAKVLGARATTAIKAAKRRLDAVSDSLKSIQDKREDAHSILKRAQKKYDDAVQECSELEAQGQHVPEDGEKDLSAPGAWKPPGIAASKARAVAKIALDRAREVYEKVAAIAKSREEKADVAKARIDAAKKLRKAAEESVKL